MKQRSPGIFICHLLLFFATTSRLNAQFDTVAVKANMIKCADSMAYGFKTRNWEVFARYTNPSVIGIMGGKAEYVNFITGVFGEVPDSAWKVYQPGKILQLIRTSPSDFQSVVELNSVIVWEGRRITAVTHLVGQSWDGGLFWTFFDSQNSRKSAVQIKPDLSPDLVIPEKVRENVELLYSPSPLKPTQKDSLPAAKRHNK